MTASGTSASRPVTSTAARRSRAAVAAVLLVLAWLPTVAPAAALEPPPEPVVATVPAGWPEPPEIDAQAYLLVDAATGQVLAGHAEHERRPVASTIKVLTVLTALERVGWDEDVTAGEEVEGVAGASVGLAPGDVWTVGELVAAIVARSGNEAANALAVHVAGSVDAFAELMAEDLASLGVTGATVRNVTGLDDRNLLSAMDLAVLARVALRHPLLGPVLGDPVVALPGTGAVESRNELLHRYPDATGVKTGFTQAAGNSLVASAQRGDRDLVAVVLDAGPDPARFDLAIALLEHGFEAFRATELSASLRFAVAGGAVHLEVPQLELTVPVDADAQLRLPVQARAPDEVAPVPIEVAGAHVADAPASLERAVPEDPPTAAGRLGRAAVDGAYAALRAGAATDSLR